MFAFILALRQGSVAAFCLEAWGQLQMVGWKIVWRYTSSKMFERGGPWTSVWFIVAKKWVESLVYGKALYDPNLDILWFYYLIWPKL